MALITCIECENKISDLAKNCPNCGAPVEISKKTPCFECGNLLENGVRTCNSCGVDQSLNPSIIPAEKPLVNQDQKVETPIQKPISTAQSSNQKTEQKDETKKEPKPEVKESITNQANKNIPTSQTALKKKSGCLKPLLITGLIILVLGFIGYQLLPDDAKRELFEALGIENSDLARQDLEAYINSEEIYSRQTLLGKWEISILVYNTHESITIRQIDIKFFFSDSDETRTFSKNLKPGKVFESVIIEKFDGHKGASYLGYEIVDARE